MYSSYPSEHSRTSESSSPSIHESAAGAPPGGAAGAAARASSPAGTANPDTNRDTFHSLLRNFLPAAIFWTLHRKSYPCVTSPADQNRNASAPMSRMTGSGSIALPLLLLILPPRSSRPYPMIHAADHGAVPVSWSHRSSV